MTFLRSLAMFVNLSFFCLWPVSSNCADLKDSSSGIARTIFNLERPYLTKLRLDEIEVLKGIGDYEAFRKSAAEKNHIKSDFKENFKKTWSMFQEYFKYDELLDASEYQTGDFRIGVDSLSEAVTSREYDCDTGSLLFLDILAAKYDIEMLSRKLSLLYLNSHFAILFASAKNEVDDESLVFDVSGAGRFTTVGDLKKKAGSWMHVIPLTSAGIEGAAQLMLSLALNNVGQIDLGLKFFEKASKLIPAPFMYLNFANSLLATERPDEAIRYIQRAQLMLPSENQTSNYLLSEAYRLEGKTQQADKFLFAAHKLRWPDEPARWKVDNSKIADSYIWSGITYLDSLRPDLARRYFEMAKKLDSKSVKESLWQEAQLDISEQPKVKLEKGDPKIADRWLNQVYLMLRSALNNAGKSSLKKEQVAWLKKRDKLNGADRVSFVWERIEVLEQRKRVEATKLIKKEGRPWGTFYGKFALQGAINRKTFTISPSEREGWVRVNALAVANNGNMAEIGDGRPEEALLLKNQVVYINDGCTVIFRPQKRAFLVEDLSTLSARCGGAGVNFSGVYTRIP